MELNENEFESEFNDEEERFSENQLNEQEDNLQDDKDSEEAYNEIKENQLNQIESRYGFHIQDTELCDERRRQIVGDESEEQDQQKFFGINKNLYRKMKNGKTLSQMIKTGTDFNLLPRNPEFLPRDDPYEPLYVPKADVLENALKREIEKFCFSDTLINRVVYDCSDPSAFTKDSQLDEFKLDMLPFYIPTSQNDTTLVFESRFESGNLRRAIQISEFEYNLILKPDYFTAGNTQWYYFSIANVRQNQEYRFNIINMMKPDSLYNQGMKPLVYSETLARQKGVGWY